MGVASGSVVHLAELVSGVEVRTVGCGAHPALRPSPLDGSRNALRCRWLRSAWSGCGRWAASGCPFSRPRYGRGPWRASSRRRSACRLSSRLRPAVSTRRRVRFTILARLDASGRGPVARGVSGACGLDSRGLRCPADLALSGSRHGQSRDSRPRRVGPALLGRRTPGGHRMAPPQPCRLGSSRLRARRPRILSRAAPRERGATGALWAVRASPSPRRGGRGRREARAATPAARGWARPGAFALASAPWVWPLIRGRSSSPCSSADCGSAAVVDLLPFLPRVAPGGRAHRVSASCLRRWRRGRCGSPPWALAGVALEFARLDVQGLALTGAICRPRGRGPRRPRLLP